MLAPPFSRPGAVLAALALWAAACTFPEITLEEGSAGSTNAGGSGSGTAGAGPVGSGAGAGGATGPGTGGVGGTGGSGSAGTGGDAQGGAGGQGAGPCVHTSNDCVNRDRDGDGVEDVHCGGTDCDDCDASVFPGQQVFFTVPRASGGYDYNCDGTSEFQYTTVQCGGGSCGQKNRFVNPTVVSCGQTAPFGGCVSVVIIGCQNDVKEERVQGCR